MKKVIAIAVVVVVALVGLTSYTHNGNQKKVDGEGKLIASVLNGGTKVADGKKLD